MGKRIWLIAGIIICLISAVGSLIWALSLYGAVYEYRSPLTASPPEPGQPLGEPLTRRVVFVLVDALRVDTAWDAGVMPFLNDLREQGAWAIMHSRAPSYSMPGYSVLLTGAWPDVSDGPAFNLDYSDIPAFTQDNLFSAAHRSGLQTAISAFYWFEKLVPSDAVSAGYYTEGEDEAADRAVVDAALPWLEDAGAYQLVLIHIDQVDHTGHLYGGGSVEWNAAASRADDLIREIAGRLDLAQDTLFICSDHGQVDQGGHGGTESIVLQEPFLLAGAGVRPGGYADVQMVDVAPTLAALLGANIPASTQGRVRTEMLAFSPDQLSVIEEAAAQQQDRLVEAYQTAIGREAPVGEAGDIVDASQQAMDAARLARLRTERAPRLIIVLLVALIPLGVVIWKHWTGTLPVIAGVAIYLLVFNAGFRLVLNRNYSYSTVAGVTDMVVAYALLTIIGVLAAGLVLVIWRRPTRQDAGSTAGLLVGMALGIVYVMLLPALLYTILYGPAIGWAFPDVSMHFWALHSLLQVCLAASAGLLFSGAAVLLARKSNRWRPANA